MPFRHMKYLVSSYYLTAGTWESIAGITKSSRALSVRSGKYYHIHLPSSLASHTASVLGICSGLQIPSNFPKDLV